jgi:hypothetical protein
MPYSSPIFDNELELYFREVRHSLSWTSGPAKASTAKCFAAYSRKRS